MKPISLRAASSRDLLFVYKLRNDSLSVKFSQSARKVALWQHIAWFNHALRSDLIQLWIAQEVSWPNSKANRVGMVRFDSFGELDLRVSIAVDERVRGAGHGFNILEQGLAKMRETARGGDTVFHATIHHSNEPSRKIFEKAGFEFKSSDGEFLMFRTN